MLGNLAMILASWITPRLHLFRMLYQNAPPRILALLVAQSHLNVLKNSKCKRVPRKYALLLSFCTIWRKGIITMIILHYLALRYYCPGRGDQAGRRLTAAGSPGVQSRTWTGRRRLCGIKLTTSTPHTITPRRTSTRFLLRLYITLLLLLMV